MFFLDERIEDMRQRINDIKEKYQNVGGLDYSKDKVQTSVKADATFVTACMQIKELEKNLNTKITELLALEEKISSAINNLDDAYCETLMFKRYILRRSWEQIAKEMKYSKRQLERLHKRAIEKIKLP